MRSKARLRRTSTTACKSSSLDQAEKILDTLQTGLRHRAELEILETGSKLWVSKFKLPRKRQAKIKPQQILNLKSTTFLSVYNKKTWENQKPRAIAISRPPNAKISSQKTFTTTSKKFPNTESSCTTTNNSVTFCTVFTIRNQQTSTGIIFIS